MLTIDDIEQVLNWNAGKKADPEINLKNQQHINQNM